MSENTSVNLSPGWLGLLGVILVVGKLTGYIQISWFWATAPFWAGLAIVLAIFVVVGLGLGGFLGGAHLLDRWNSRKRQKRWLAAEKARLNQSPWRPR